MELIGALKIFSGTSSSGVDGVGCVLAQAVKDLSVCMDAEDFIELFEPRNREELSNSIFHMIMARWLASLHIPACDIKLPNCPHWLSEHIRVGEFILMTGRRLDFISPDA